MADGPYLIKVKLDIVAGNEKPVSETAEFSVQAMCVTQVIVKAAGTDGDSPIDVSVAPAVANAIYFQFLLVRPLLLGKDPIKATDLVDPGDWKTAYLEYSVPLAADTDHEQRKPLRGAHVFANGQTEWITDMLKDGHPGGLTQLRFWNSKKPADPNDMPPADVDKLKGKTPAEIQAAKEQWAEGRNDITVQIITGYVPIVAPATNQTAQKK